MGNLYTILLSGTVGVLISSLIIFINNCLDRKNRKDICIIKASIDMAIFDATAKTQLEKIKIEKANQPGVYFSKSVISCLPIYQREMKNILKTGELSRLFKKDEKTAYEKAWNKDKEIKNNHTKVLKELGYNIKEF